MKELLESLEVSEDVKSILTESFDKAVQSEVTKLVESKEAEYKEYLAEEIQKSQTELSEQLDSYLERVVEEFVKQNTFAIDESIQREKYDAVLEGFESLLTTVGVDVATIAEAKEEGSEVQELMEAKEEVSELADSLMEENIKLKELNAELLKTGLIKEQAETLTTVEKDKFYKLAEVLDFKEEDAQGFLSKLETLSEAVKSKGKERVTEGLITENKEQTVTEKVKEIQDNKVKDIKDMIFGASHLYK